MCVIHSMHEVILYSHSECLHGIQSCYSAYMHIPEYIYVKYSSVHLRYSLHIYVYTSICMYSMKMYLDVCMLGYEISTARYV